MLGLKKNSPVPACFAAITVILAAAGTQFPPAVFILLPVFAALIALLTLAANDIFIGLTCLTVLGISYAISHGFLMPSIFACGIAAGLMISQGYRRKLTLVPLLTSVCLIFLALFGGIILVANAAAKTSVINQTVIFMIENAKLTLPPLFENWQGTAGTPEQLGTLLDEIGRIYLTFMPAILIICSLLMAYISIVLCKRLLFRRLNLQYILTPFHRLRLSRGSVVALGASALLSSSFAGQTVNTAFLNMTLILSFLCIVCAMSLCYFFIRESIKNPILSVLVFLAVPAFINLSPFTLLLLTFLGAADAFKDFRHIRQREEQ